MTNSTFTVMISPLCTKGTRIASFRFIKNVILIVALTLGIVVNAQEQGKITLSGTGFAISENLIVTNHHVVNGAEIIYVRGINGDLGKRVKCKVLSSSEFYDIAILEITDVNEKISNIPYGIDTIYNVGEDIYIIGFPRLFFYTDDVQQTFSRRSLSAGTGYDNFKNNGIIPDETRFVFDASIQNGNSGSPIFNKFGDIIGVATMGSISNVSSVIQNFNTGVKINTLRSIFDSLGKK